jgi:hypothetical protein
MADGRAKGTRNSPPKIDFAVAVLAFDRASIPAPKPEPVVPLVVWR